MDNFKLGDTISTEFATCNPQTGAAQNADTLPVGTLNKNGTDDALTVTVVNLATGRYKATFTPTSGASFSASDKLTLTIAATVNSVAGVGKVWEGRLNAALGSDNLMLLSTDAQDRSATLAVNAKALGGTTQTGRDIGANVLLSVGTGTGQVNVSSGKVPATVAAGDIATDAITAAAVKADAVTKIQAGSINPSTVYTSGLTQATMASSKIYQATSPGNTNVGLNGPEGNTYNITNTEFNDMNFFGAGGDTYNFKGCVFKRCRIDSHYNTINLDGCLVRDTELMGLFGIYQNSGNAIFDNCLYVAQDGQDSIQTNLVGHGDGSGYLDAYLFSCGGDFKISSGTSSIAFHIHGGSMNLTVDPSASCIIQLVGTSGTVLKTTGSSTVTYNGTTVTNTGSALKMGDTSTVEGEVTTLANKFSGSSNIPNMLMVMSRSDNMSGVPVLVTAQTELNAHGGDLDNTVNSIEATSISAASAVSNTANVTKKTDVIDGTITRAQMDKFVNAMAHGNCTIPTAGTYVWKDASGATLFTITETAGGRTIS